MNCGHHSNLHEQEACQYSKTVYWGLNNTGEALFKDLVLFVAIVAVTILVSSLEDFCFIAIPFMQVWKGCSIVELVVLGLNYDLPHPSNG